MPARASAPNHHGTHFLRSPAVAADLVRSSGVGRDDLVLDLGAGAGAITAPLAATGARVLAVERNARFVDRLSERFADTGNVRVIHADVRTVPLPRRPYRVVANIPFALSTALLRRLLQSPTTRMAGADLVVEWGFARRMTRPSPRDLETAWWASRFHLTLRQRVSRTCFTPPPTVDAAHLSIRPRPGVGPRVSASLWWLLGAAYSSPHRTVQALVADVSGLRRVRGALGAAGVGAGTPAAQVTVDQWAAIARNLAEAPVSWPALPRSLSRV
ncbi:23S rRNA (adenine-N6)-dimethyltransferase [Streptoalloteichus tenebrarius]|uniref:23S rRNA (Adenine-N6)-dimethyltransferase n=1 Tax=Streptoalloteichus tenebrarius (strain ATCC 17920 / DSM 40477 / JCM 4838 / CBS 697.72 / NBRC 16177 / NCIMB 11028 / NRRL B-12390 / A12253. 1 / ISP 5477) TaxID=1933 RepID=A0ABT1HRN5_STRSD|nr:rRNA adenine N(6)-methyltransferase family protein [Streptoalloteichus tenebrarius]MCP2258180.1 23S rRNA (adenine-N6)-dimethyltransferase [Streptoalloteichus tenebrarius]BFF04594.1 hypothetical protein GCM10020241_62690 [Streptoalloteichus tenebrarius]